MDLAPQVAPGVQDENNLRQGGFSEPEIQQWKQDTIDQLHQGGFSEDEIAAHFGTGKINQESLKSVFQKNAQAHEAAQPQAAPDRKPSQSVPDLPNPFGGETVDQHHALIDDISKYFGMAKEVVKDGIHAGTQGMQSSAVGLYLRGKLPDVPPEHASSYYNIASQIGTIAGDALPIAGGMGLGGIAGGTIGALVGGPVGAGIGATVGANFGGGALPEALRSHFVNALEKGDAKNFTDWWEQASSTFLKTLKAGTVNAATMGVGGKVGQVLGGMGANALVKAGSVGAAEIATMVSLGKGLEGKMPETQDFTNAALVVGALHGIGALTKAGTGVVSDTAGKLRDIYSKTGATPPEVAELAKTDPTVPEALLSDNKTVPDVLGGDKEVSQEKPIEETPTPEQTEEQKLETAKSKILDHIKSSMDESGDKFNFTFDDIKQKLVDGFHGFKTNLNDLYTSVVNKIAPLSAFTENAKKGEVRPSQDPKQLAAIMPSTVNSRFKKSIYEGTMDFKTLQKNGKGLMEIFKPLKGDLNGWRAYAVAKRVVELSEQGREHGFPLTQDEANLVVKAGSDKYEGVTQEFYDYRKRLIQYLVDGGVISKGDAKAFQDKNLAHVPFARHFEEEEQAQGKGAGGMVPSKPIKAYKGSERPIIDPIETTMRDTQRFIQMAESNRVMLAMKKRAQTFENPDELMERVKAPTKEISLDPKEIQNVLEQHGVYGVDPKPFEIYRRYAQRLAPDEIQLFNRGEREVYRVDPDIAQAVKSGAIDSQILRMATSLLNVPVKTLREGTVANPAFAFAHMFRSQFIAATQSRNGFVPFYHLFKGFYDMAKDPKAYDMFQKAAGNFDGFNTIDEDFLKNSISELNEKTGILESPLNVIKKPLELMHWMVIKSDEASRFAEFKLSTKGDYSLDALVKGGNDARDLTMDYQRAGAAASIKAMRLITGFWNARVQGMDRMARAFAENPSKFLFKSFLAYTMPSTLLYFANRNDPRWNDGSIPRWQKDLFWIVLTKDHIIRVPKPFEGGMIFATGAERLLDHLSTHNPDAFKEYAKRVLVDAGPGYMPTFLSPLVEQYYNKSSLTGSPIIPKDREGLLPQDQYSDHTSETAKKLGQFVRLFTGRESSFSSPAIIENYVRAWGGQLGNYALQLSDKLGGSTGILPKNNSPAWSTEEMPFIRSFMIKNNTTKNQNITDFYEKYAEVEKFLKSKKFEMMHGDYQSMANDQYLNLSNVMNSMHKQSAFVHSIADHPYLKPIEKAQIIEPAIKGMIQTAKSGLMQYKLFEDMQKQLNQGR